MVQVSTYEVLTLLILFGTFLVALLACIDRNNKRK
ncbi:putative holin-like toxin [Lachnospiraceae bacterium 54-11]